jgi:hypothetical protein
MNENIKFNITHVENDGIYYRKCRECRQIKELNITNFLKRTTKNGWRGKCRICYNKAYRKRQELSKSEKLVSKKYRLKYMKTQPLEFLFRSAKGNAKRVDREFSIIIKDLYFLWEKQKGLCYYTNREMLFELGSNSSVSIDRIDSSIGYTVDNIVLCQRQVNIMKNNASIEELLLFCKDTLKTLQK